MDSHSYISGGIQQQQRAESVPKHAVRNACLGFVTLTSGMPVGLAVGATLGFGVAAGDVDGVGDGVDDVASFGWFTMSFSPLTVPVSLTVSVYLVRFTR